MTEHPYPKGDDLDLLLDKRAPGLSYLWPLAVAAGLVPEGAKPLDAFELVKTWDKSKDRLATETMAELYALVVLWAQVDRVRGRLANAQAERVQGWLAAEQGAENAPYAYEYWAGDRQVPAPDIEGEDPEVVHEHLWREYNRREKLFAGKLEGMCSRSEGFRDQTAHATQGRVSKADRTRDFIVAEARRMKGDRQVVAASLADMVLALDEKTHSRPQAGRILNILGEEFQGDAAWEGRHD